ncbi:unnamed protein product [Blepharisma stoltei]|uniref:HMG box domain-containing protein n=1 Tax=Blepharisma stoltei TaxID=1481888 RepID=A0AAU9ITM4_9CILI|nr:unnamed protein product [Blepharisma stoltei]
MSSKRQQKMQEKEEEPQKDENFESDESFEEEQEDARKKDEKEVQMPPPKRNKSAYLFWTLEKRPEIMEKYPGIDGREILIKLGKLWKKTSEKDKEPYNKKYVEDRERYERQMLDYEKKGKYYDNEGHLDRSQFFGRRRRSRSSGYAAFAKRKSQAAH